MSGIFKAYDIRGKSPEEIDKEMAFKIGKAFGDFKTCDTVLVGYDARETSKNLSHGLISGLNSSGKKVINIGLCSTPMFYFAINKLGVKGGIMITASHLGSEYNGFKLVEEGAISLTYDSGIGKIGEMVKNIEFVETEPVCEKIDLKKDYVDFVTKRKIENIGKISVDTGNGMGGFVIEDVLKRIGIDYSPIYCEIDMSFPNHEANPLKKETLEELRKDVIEGDSVAGFAFDGDADRLGVLDEKGNFVPADFIIALISKNILKKGSEKILYDLRSSKSVPETIKKEGGIPIKSRVGHSFISRKMKKDDIFFGGELSGHFYFKESFYVESSILTMLNILELLSKTGKKLSELVSELKKYSKTDEINFSVENKVSKLKEIENHYRKAGAKIEKIDGVTVEFKDWWFNIRPSNTEDLLRLNLEAHGKELMDEKVREVEKIIKD